MPNLCCFFAVRESPVAALGVATGQGIDSLVEAGIEEGDTVIIGDLKFDFVY